MSEPGTTRARLLAVIATILVVLALKLSRPVTLPLVAAIFLLILAWPLQERLERALPRWLAWTITLLAVLLVLALFIAALVWSAERIAEKAPQYGDRVRQLYEHVIAWARAHNLTVPSGQSGQAQLGEQALNLLNSLLKVVYTAAGLVLLMIAYLALGLLEVRDFRAKVKQRLRRRYGDELLQTVETIAGRVQRYIVALALTCVIAGAATTLFAFAIGLDFPFIWGLQSFLLNFIPTLGPTVAVVPPTLFALLQFEGLGRPLAVFFGMGFLQFAIGNFIDPKIGGKFMSLSALVVLWVIAFWGWIWGVLGALLAVPLTVAVVIVCSHFASTRWIAAIVTDIKDEEKEETKSEKHA
jgi:AI-2 transport protein TqsA